MNDRSYLSIGDVLALLQEEFPDVTISKIRFLESRGLLVPERTPSGYRKFYEHDVERLRWILRQQRENFLPLKVIKGRLEGQLPPAEPAALFEVGDRAAIGPPPNGSSEALDDPAGEHEETAEGEERESVAVHATVGAPWLEVSESSDSSSAGVRSVEARGPAISRDEVPEEVARGSVRQSGPVAPSPASSRAAAGAESRGSASGSGGLSVAASPVHRPSPALQSAPGTVIPRPSSSSGPVPRVASGAGMRADRPGGSGGVAGGAGGDADSAGGVTSSGSARLLSPGAVGPAGSGGTMSAAASGRSSGTAGPAGSAGADTGIGSTAGRTPGARPPSAKVTPPGSQPPIDSSANPAAAGAARSPSASAPGAGSGALERAAELADELAGANMTAAELAQATGLTVAAVEELESYGLIESRSVAGVACYDEAAVVVAGLAASFAKFGIEARHLRIFKHAAERQASLYSQIVMPLLRQRNPVARRRAGEDLQRLVELGASMQECFVKAAQRDLTGG